MSTFAVLCPGQGMQSPEMYDLVNADPKGRQSLDAFESSLEMDLRADARAGLRLFDNTWAQPAIVALARSTWDMLSPRLAEFGLAPSVFAGYSVGEVSAWACAGTWSLEHCGNVARSRAQLMEIASPPDCGMVAVLGLSVSDVSKELDRHADGDSACYIAIVNDVDHVVIAGNNRALDCAEATLQAQGGATRRLDVRVPSHTPLLATAGSRFGQYLSKQQAFAPSAVVLRGIDARRLLRPEEAAYALSSAIAAPIRWSDCMWELVESGIKVALELGPGRSLTKLMASACPAIAVRSVADFRSADGIVAWLRRHLER